MGCCTQMHFFHYSTEMDEIELIQPDDFHHHIRDNSQLKDLVKHCISQQWGKVLIMPNTNPPITTTEKALEYKEVIPIYLKI